MHTERKPRTALWAIGGFAIAGLLHLGAGLYWDDSRIAIMGAGALVFGLVLGLATETFRLRTSHVDNPASAVPVANPAGRKVEYNYLDETVMSTPRAGTLSKVWDPSHVLATPTGVGMDLKLPEEELIEFELVEEKQLPTKLVVPSAFHNEPPTVSREVTVSTGQAMQRRKEMVSGLPLLTSILADEPPAATQVAPAQPGKTRGQCSACGTMLWAPSQRPLRLRCPRCGHVRTLTA
ncbi:MAG TPA: hypothetical protein VGB18_05895 [Candidatus Thermoplasmatota archaeon]